MTTMNTKMISGLVGLGLAVNAISSELPTEVHQPLGKPNIIVILADDMGFGDTSAFGGAISTPYLEQMAEQGMRFYDFHSNGAVSSPTRAALLTGRYQQRSGMTYALSAQRPERALSPNELTIADVLQSEGYATGIFGKWHLGNRPENNPLYYGFDRFVGYKSGNVDFHSHVTEAGNHDWWHDKQLTQEAGYVTHLLTHHAKAFIRENKDQPFFAYVAHEAPHFPYQGPDDDAIRFTGQGRQPVFYGEGVDVPRAYREMMYEMDKSVGELMALLKELELDENTLVIFSSDNGPLLRHTTKYEPDFNSAGDLRDAKGTLYEGGHRVPTITMWPGKIEAGSRSDEILLLMDLFPTLAALANAGIPEDRIIDGVDFSDVMLKGETLPERAVFWRLGILEPRLMNLNTPLRSVRKGNWKLIGDELYNLHDDIGETKNLAEQYTDIVVELQSLLEGWEGEMPEG